MASNATKTGGAVIIMLLAFVGYLIFKKIRMANSLQFSFKSFDIGGNILQPEVYITITVSNSTMTSAVLESINGNIFADNSRKIASVNTFIPTTIAALSAVDLVLKIDPVISDLITTIKNFISSPGTLISFIGSAKVDGITLPLQTSISLQQLQNQPLLNG